MYVYTENREQLLALRVGSPRLVWQRRLAQNETESVRMWVWGI